MVICGTNLILGDGLTSKALVAFLSKHSSNNSILKNIDDFEDTDFSAFDLIVTSPGIPAHHPVFNAIEKVGCNYYSDIDIFLKFNQTPTIAVTGTNGKTSVSTMLKYALEASGYKTRMGGNQAISALSLLEIDDVDYTILELSSFQICHSASLSVDLGVVTNIEPDHLDWHQSFKHYKASKEKLLACSKSSIFDASLDNVSLVQSICDKLNITLSPKILHELSEFTLAHRQEVFHLNNITFINDSKATNIAAVQAFLSKNQSPGQTHLILGGSLKGDIKFSPLNTFSDQVTFYAYGQTKSIICSQLDVSFSDQALASVLDRVFSIAKKGDTVVLSPGCASFDQFKNYQERGDFFKHYVRQFYKTT